MIEGDDRIAFQDGHVTLVEMASTDVLRAAMMLAFDDPDLDIIWAPRKWNSEWNADITIGALRSCLDWGQNALNRFDLLPEASRAITALVTLRILGCDSNAPAIAISNILARQGLDVSVDAVVNALWDPIEKCINQGVALPDLSVSRVTITLRNGGDANWAFEGPDTISDEMRANLRTVETWVDRLLIKGCGGNTAQIVAEFENGDERFEVTIKTSIVLPDGRVADMDTRYVATDAAVMMAGARARILEMVRGWIGG